MADDHTFIDTITDLAKTVNNAIRRGQIYGPVVDVLNFSLVNIGGNVDAPLSLHRRPVRFAVPHTFNLRTGERLMAVHGLSSTLGTTVPVEFDNVAGTSVPEPTGTPVITTSDPAISAVTLNSNGSSVDIVPVSPVRANTPFTVTYTLGAIVFTQEFQFTLDETATQGHFITTGDTNFPLPDAAPAPTPTPTP